MADGNLPDVETLRKLISYDPETGALTWRPRPSSLFSSDKQSAEHNAAIWNGRRAGSPAMPTLTEFGHQYGSVLGKKVKAHRVAWAIYHGRWPTDQIDHINGDPADNRIENLREVSQCENMRNQRRSSRNTSGAIGVRWESGKWRAQMSLKSGRLNLGRFSNFEDAVAARKAAEAKYGFHENHGRE